MASDRFKLSDQDNPNIAVDYLEITLVDLTNIPKDSDDLAALWARFMSIQGEEDLDALSNQNEYIDEAIRVLKEMNNDKSLYDLFKSEEDAIEDYKRSLYVERKEALQEGLEQGIKETAKNLKDEKVSIEVISKVTGLSKEEIEKL